MKKAVVVCDNRIEMEDTLSFFRMKHPAAIYHKLDNRLITEDLEIVFIQKIHIDFIRGSEYDYAIVMETVTDSYYTLNSIVLPSLFHRNGKHWICKE